MELYMKGKDHRRMILNSVENGPMVWPNVTLEDGTTVRPKTYEELSELEKLHNTCDLKAANIVLQVYSPPPQSTPYGLPLHQKHYLPQSQSTFNHSQPSVTQSAYPQIIMPQQPQQSQVELLQMESGLFVPMFLPGDDLIACLNKAMTFMSTVFSLRFPPTNNQLRSSFNPRNQATVQDGRITIQQVQKRQDGSADQTFTHNVVFQTDDLDAYDSDCDEIPSGAVILMTNLSSCDPKTVFKVHYSDYAQNGVFTQSVHELQYSKQSQNVVYPDIELMSDSNVIPYS
nr:hypothetical protein [Tanacetum cinerariifolium]